VDSDDSSFFAAAAAAAATPTWFVVVVDVVVDVVVEVWVWTAVVDVVAVAVAVAVAVVGGGETDSVLVIVVVRSGVVVDVVDSDPDRVVLLSATVAPGAVRLTLVNDTDLLRVALPLTPAPDPHAPSRTAQAPASARTRHPDRPRTAVPRSPMATAVWSLDGHLSCRIPLIVTADCSSLRLRGK
jgi:hypothetical protein